MENITAEKSDMPHTTPEKRRAGLHMRKSSLPVLGALVFLLFFCGCGQNPPESPSSKSRSSGDIQLKLAARKFSTSKGQHLKLDFLVLNKEGRELSVDGRDLSFSFAGKKVFPCPVKSFFSGEIFPIASEDYEKPVENALSSRWTFVTAPLVPGDYHGELKARSSSGEGAASFSSTVAPREKWVESRPANLVFYHGYDANLDTHYVGAYVEWNAISSLPGSSITSYSVMGIKESEHIGFIIETTGEEEDKLGPPCLAALARRPALCARYYMAGDNWQETENELREYYNGWEFTVTPNFDKALIIENLKIEPGTISRGGETTITAHVGYSPQLYWAPEDIIWEAFIYKEDSPGIYAVIGSGAGENVSFTWDGKTWFASGKHPVPDGRYLVLVGAYCGEGAYGSTTGELQVASPQVKKMKFLNTWNLYGMNNRRIKAVWNRGNSPRYQWQTFPLELVGAAYLRSQGTKAVEDDAEEEYAPGEEEPTVTEIDSLTMEEPPQAEDEEDAATMKAAGDKARVEVSFELNPPPIKKETYLIKAEDPENLVKIAPAAEVTFGPNGAIKKETCDLLLPKSVQRVKSLVWSCKKKGEKQWKWMEETFFYKGEGEEGGGGGGGVGVMGIRAKDSEDPNPEEDEDYSKEYEGGGIYVTLSEPLGPMENRLRIELLNVACEKAKGAKTKQEVRELLTSGIFNWLSERDFGYAPNSVHLEEERNSLVFFLTDFLRDISKEFNNPAKTGGNCVDVSTFYRFACNAMGAKMWCRQVIGQSGALFNTNLCRAPGRRQRTSENDPWENTDFKSFYFSMHQFGNFTVNNEGGARYVWDPTLLFMGSPFSSPPYFAAKTPWEDYKRYLTPDPIELGDVLPIDAVKTYQMGGDEQ